MHIQYRIPQVQHIAVYIQCRKCLEDLIWFFNVHRNSGTEGFHFGRGLRLMIIRFRFRRVRYGNTRH